MDVSSAGGVMWGAIVSFETVFCNLILGKLRNF
jgi:hypothetical protein